MPTHSFQLYNNYTFLAIGKKPAKKPPPKSQTPPPRGCGCADTLGGFRYPALPFDPISFVLPKETVSSRQRKALFYPGGSTIRVSATASVVFTHLRPTWGGAGACLWLSTCAPISWVWVVTPYCRFHPISLVLAQRNGVEPPKKSALKPPRHLGGPARLSHLGVSPNGTNWCVKLICTRWVDRALKSA